MKRIGIDLHGVIDHYIDFWMPWMAVMLSNGDEAYVISGPPKKEIVTELDTYNLVKGKHYTGILSVVDYLMAKNTLMWMDHKNTWWASDADWWTSKGELCSLFEIDEMWDDQARYKLGFPPGHRAKLLIYTKGYITRGEDIDLEKLNDVRKFLEVFDKNMKNKETKIYVREMCKKT